VLTAEYLKPNVLPLFYLLITISGIFTYNILFSIYSKWLQSRKAEPKQYILSIHLQLILDLFFLTLFLHFLGGLETPFFILYVIYVSIASILLSRTFSFVYAGLASFLYIGLLILEWLEVVAHYNLTDFRSPTRYQQPIHIFSVSFSLVATVFLTAYFISSIVVKLRERERELMESNLACEQRAQELSKLNLLLEEQDKARAQFIYLVTHELRAPIAAIQSYLRLILEGYVPPEKHRDIISKSEQQALKQLALISDLLQLAKLQEEKILTKVEPVDLKAVLEEVVDLMKGQAEEKNIRLDVEIDPEIPIIEVDKEHMKQLWTDLISNSIKYTNPGGSVTVSLQQDSEQLIGVVADTGIGIAAEDIPQIFNDFYRAKNAKATERQGTGLGLPIVKRILDTYGGEITVESKLRQGSKFTFTLPKKGNISSGVYQTESHKNKTD
jgi:signal transduction histidine kinase